MQQGKAPRWQCSPSANGIALGFLLRRLVVETAIAAVSTTEVPWVSAQQVLLATVGWQQSTSWPWQTNHACRRLRVRFKTQENRVHRVEVVHRVGVAREGGLEGAGALEVVAAA